jgi:hypothetical protein
LLHLSAKSFGTVIELGFRFRNPVGSHPLFSCEQIVGDLVGKQGHTVPTQLQQKMMDTLEVVIIGV